MAVMIMRDVCRGCKMCMRACPFRAIEMRDGRAYINEKCTGCGSCVIYCPVKAIEED